MSKVLTTGRARYPDALVLRGDPAPAADTVEPVAVFEVLSASTALTDLRIKP
ncbi:MAG: Uma2 family endonuclease [Acetobacteraceae bacterium]|nr:Uma2 family endonuclease [Acetobacteraceae bacterium]